MIIDLSHFVAQERPYWEQLERELTKIERNPYDNLSLEAARELHYLYERTSSDLAKVSAMAAAGELRGYLESLVARAYGEIHSGRSTRRRLPWRFWLFAAFPRAFRRHVGAFWISTALTMLGVLVGCALFKLAPDAKRVILPFEHVQVSPTERVRMEEEQAKEHGLRTGDKATFSASLMNNNISVSLRAFGFGIGWGVFTILILFYNGVILGLVMIDYIVDGQGMFLAAWLLPHGVIEIPAILVGGQAGLMVAAAVIGWDSRRTMGQRFRAISEDLMILLGGLAGMLVWAGLVEAFISQDHGPNVYLLKIFFGVIELAALVVYLGFGGRGAEAEQLEQERET